MSSLAIVQARMGSTRLPGKVLMALGSMSVLELLVHRLRRSRLDGIVIATSDLPLDDPIAEAAAGLAVPCVRGPERDVLARYLCALDEHPATEVVRITDFAAIRPVGKGGFKQYRVVHSDSPSGGDRTALRPR